MRRPSLPTSLALVLVAAVAIAATAGALTVEDAKASHRPLRIRHRLQGIHKIRHVVIIMQENRSFDSYFGTFAGADGIPMRDGKPAVCAPNPLSGRCERPFRDRNDLNHGGPHDLRNSVADVDRGRMDGFVREAV